MVIRFNNGYVTTIDFRETAPERAHKDMFLDSEGNPDVYMSRYSSSSSGVPGTVYGLGYAHEKYGTQPWSTLIYPSINLAKYTVKEIQKKKNIILGCPSGRTLRKTYKHIGILS